MRPVWHPSRRRLAEWAETGEPPSVTAHVARCDRCADRLEELSSPVPSLSAALTTTLQPPDDLVPRLGARMSDAMRNREDLAILIDLMGVPLHAVRSALQELEEEGR